MRTLLLTAALALALPACSGCEKKDEAPAPAPEVAAPTPAPAPAAAAAPAAEDPMAAAARENAARHNPLRERFEPRYININGQKVLAKPAMKFMHVRPADLMRAQEGQPGAEGQPAAQPAQPAPAK